MEEHNIQNNVNDGDTKKEVSYNHLIYHLKPDTNNADNGDHPKLTIEQVDHVQIKSESCSQNNITELTVKYKLKNLVIKLERLQQDQIESDCNLENIETIFENNLNDKNPGGRLDVVQSPLDSDCCSEKVRNVEQKKCSQKQLSVNLEAIVHDMASDKRYSVNTTFTKNIKKFAENHAQSIGMHQATLPSSQVVSLSEDSLSEELYQNSKFQCAICDEVVMDKFSFSRHLKSHGQACEKSSVQKSIPKNYEHLNCDISKNVSKNTFDHSHLKKNHSSKRSNHCEVCDKKFTLRNNLLRHLKLHTEDKAFSCIICNKRYSRNADLIEHLRIHTDENAYQCKICKKTFSSKRCQYIHSQICGKNRFSCNDCRECFMNELQLIDHRRTKHINLKLYCRFCNNFYKDSAQLQKHNKNCAHRVKKLQYSTCKKNLTNKLFKCDVCNTTFTRKENWNQHMKKYHRETEQFQCKYCDAKFFYQSLRKHYMRCHSQKKSFECKVCGKVFKQNGALTQHLKIHTGQKPHVCCICWLPFYEKSQLRKHLRIHTGERPYECGVCKKAFTRGTHLRDHLRLHTGEKPYICNICNKAFCQKSILNKHLRGHMK